MRQIVGYVRTADTDIGVERLVVSAFDSGGAPPIMRKHAPTAEVLQALGRHITSALTDSKGYFALPAEDLEFAGNEPRPDLVIVVYAPEVVEDWREPYPEKHALYISLVPRIDAGAQDAVVIRLGREVLTHYHIGTGAFEQTSKARDALANEQKARHFTELARKADARKTAVKCTQNLNAVPIAMRRNKLLLIGKAALTEKVEEDGRKIPRIEVLQRELLFEGLTDLKKKADPKKPKMRLRMGAEELRKLELKIQDGKVTGTLSHDALWETVVAMHGGVDLVRKRGMSNPSPATLEQRYLKATPPTQTAAPRTTRDDSPRRKRRRG